MRGVIDSPALQRHLRAEAVDFRRQLGMALDEVEEGLRIEAQATADHAKRITPELIEKRRTQVQKRGREQSSS